jgi:uncharacterized protein YuzE
MAGPLKYDSDADALYYRFKDDAVGYTTVVSDGISADFTDDATVIGIEVLSPPGMKQLMADLEELSQLRVKVERQRACLTELNRALRRKNLELDALHYVWCSGGCPGGVHRWHSELLITEELIQVVEVQAERLRSWYDTVKHRHRRASGQPEGSYFRLYSDMAAAKTSIAVLREEEEKEEEGKELSWQEQLKLSLLRRLAKKSQLARSSRS